MIKHLVKQYSHSKCQPTDGNRLTKKERGSCLLQRGTTKRLQKHKHNPRHTARAFIVPIGVFAIKNWSFSLQNQ